MDVLDRSPRLDFFPVLAPVNPAPLDPAAIASVPGDFAQALSLVPAVTPAPLATATFTVAASEPQPVPATEAPIALPFDPATALTAYRQHRVPSLPPATEVTPAPIPATLVALTDITPSDSPGRSEVVPPPIAATVTTAAVNRRVIPTGLSAGLTIDPSPRRSLTTEPAAPVEATFTPATTSFVVTTFTTPVSPISNKVAPQIAPPDSTPSIAADDDDAPRPTSTPSFITFTIPQPLPVVSTIAAAPPRVEEPALRSIESVSIKTVGSASASIVPAAQQPVAPIASPTAVNVPVASVPVADAPAVRPLATTFPVVPAVVANPSLQPEGTPALEPAVPVVTTKEDPSPQPTNLSTAVVANATQPVPVVPARSSAGDVSATRRSLTPSNPLAAALEPVIPTPSTELLPVASSAAASPVPSVTSKSVPTKSASAKPPSAKRPATEDGIQGAVTSDLITSLAVALPAVAPPVPIPITTAVEPSTSATPVVPTVARPTATESVGPAVTANPVPQPVAKAGADAIVIPADPVKPAASLPQAVLKKAEVTTVVQKTTSTEVVERVPTKVAVKESTKAKEDLPTEVVAPTSVRPRESIALTAPALDFGDPVPIHEAQQVVQRLGDAIGLAHESGQHLSIRITPPQFGPIVVGVSMHEGVMSARVETHSALAQQMLTDHLPQLHEALSARGAVIDRIDIVPVENRAGDRPARVEAISTEASANGWLSSETPGHSGYEPQDAPPRRPPPQPITLKPPRETAAVEPTAATRPLQLQELNVRV